MIRSLLDITGDRVLNSSRWPSQPRTNRSSRMMVSKPNELMEELLTPSKPAPPVVGKVTHYSINLQWDEAYEQAQKLLPKNGQRLRVVLQEQDANSGSKQQWGTVYTGFGKSFVVEGLLPDRSYTYRLCFKNDFGAGDWSQPVLVQTTKEPFSGDHIHRAIRSNDILELKKILESNVNVESMDQLGFTPLMNAAQKGLIDLCELLIVKGADVNYRTDSLKTALMLAAYAGQLETCKFLVERGADAQAQDRAGSSALHCAIDGQHRDVAEFLLEHGVDVNIRDFGSNWTPLLRCAATHGNFEIADLLLTHGADVNAKDRDSKTALMMSAINGHMELTNKLMVAGADLSVRSEFGKTAYEFAISMDRRRVVRQMEIFMEAKGIAYRKL